MEETVVRVCVVDAAGGRRTYTISDGERIAAAVRAAPGGVVDVAAHQVGVDDDERVLFAVDAVTATPVPRDRGLLRLVGGSRERLRRAIALLDSTISRSRR